MERMEAARAFKSSFSSELAMKSTNPQGFPDDFWCINGGDDFSIDEFFDLPNEEDFEEDEEKKASSSLSLSSSQEHLDDSNSNSLNFTPDLAIPVRPLSFFVFSGFFLSGFCQKLKLFL